jgi:hypothetical protein
MPDFNQYFYNVFETAQLYFVKNKISTDIISIYDVKFCVKFYSGRAFFTLCHH